MLLLGWANLTSPTRSRTHRTELALILWNRLATANNRPKENRNHHEGSWSMLLVQRTCHLSKWLVTLPTFPFILARKLKKSEPIHRRAGPLNPCCPTCIGSPQYIWVCCLIHQTVHLYVSRIELVTPIGNSVAWGTMGSWPVHLGMRR